jgi:hypothetical protein
VDGLVLLVIDSDGLILAVATGRLALTSARSASLAASLGTALDESSWIFGAG